MGCVKVFQDFPAEAGWYDRSIIKQHNWAMGGEPLTALKEGLDICAPVIAVVGDALLNHLVELLVHGTLSGSGLESVPCDYLYFVS